MAITLCNSCKNHCKWGYLYDCVNYTPIPNDEEIMTNEEWIKSLDTEQLADVLAKQKCDGCNDEPYDEEYGVCKYCMAKKKEQIREWLKQPHTD